MCGSPTCWWRSQFRYHRNSVVLVCFPKVWVTVFARQSIRTQDYRLVCWFSSQLLARTRRRKPDSNARNPSDWLTLQGWSQSIRIPSPPGHIGTETWVPMTQSQSEEDVVIRRVATTELDIPSKDRPASGSHVVHAVWALVCISMDAP